MAYLNLSSNSYIVMQWCNDHTCNFIYGIATPLYDNIGRGLMMNSGTSSFLIGTQDIGPHEVS